MTISECNVMLGTVWSAEWEAQGHFGIWQKTNVFSNN